MKTALVILPACLLALAHLISAQILANINCEQVRNLSPQCMRAVEQTTSADGVRALCRGNCFGPVLRAFESCRSDQEAAATVQRLQEGCARNSNGDFCLPLIISSGTQAADTCINSNGDQCSDNCRNALQPFGCCANSPALGFNLGSICGINSRCQPATGGTGGTGRTGGGTSALHSTVGILMSLIFTGLALMFK